MGKYVVHIATCLAGSAVALLLFAGCDGRDDALDGIPDDARRSLASELEAELTGKLDVWYPRVIDEADGGYLSNFAHDWKEMDEQEKFIVTQARHVWTLSKMAERYPDREGYADYAKHGVTFLQEKMWDAAYGGFHETVTREGEPIPDQHGELSKTLYGNAFAIYGLAAYYGFSQDVDALALAQDAFAWLENHAHDPVHKGYFQPLARDGTPTTTGYPKDYNSGIHILEALAELYTVWPDSLVRARLEENFYLVRDTMTADKGYLKLYFDAAWTHRSYRDSSETVIRENLHDDHVTPGHDIETSFLLLEAAHVLGIDEDPETHRVAKALTDHTLENGFDEANGGIYDAGYYFKGADTLTILRDSKAWWGQAEGLHTLGIMSDVYPDDPHEYFETFRKQWDYITMYLIDHEHGGWYDLGLDTSPDRRTARKSQIWKGNYHTVRSLSGAIDRLNSQTRQR